MTTRLIRAAVAMTVAWGVSVALAQGSQQATGGHRLDWYHWAHTTASPYLSDIRALADGNPATTCAHMDGPQIGGWIQFAFPHAVHVTELRLFQDAGRPADSFELRADEDGRGEYRQVVATVAVDRATIDQWTVIPVGRPVHGLRIIALSGSVGYRSPYPVYREIEIYTRDRIHVEQPATEAALQTLKIGPSAGQPDLSRKEIHFTPCIDLWMAGLALGENMPQTGEEVNATEGFRNMLRIVRSIDAQGVRLFLEMPCVENKMPWISDHAYHYGRDTLRGVMEALHSNGLTGSLFLHAWISPFQRQDNMLPMPDRRWDYPYEQSSLVAAKGLYPGYEKDRYPCVISDDHFKSHWTGLLKEAVERGVDGVYVMPDEYYFKSHDLDTAECPSCARELRKRYGYDSLPKLGPGRSGYSAVPGVGPEPRRVADTEHFRKWKLFEYEMLADLFNDVAGQLKAINPNLTLVSSANPGSTYTTNRRLEHGLAFDIIGRGRNFNAVQLYAHVPVGLGEVGIHTALARRMRASHPHADLLSSIQSLNFNTLPPDGNEIRFMGYVLPHVMAGARRIDLYRLSYVDGPWLPVVGRGIAMVRILESWGIRDSSSAAKTCLLLSRASEDWWQVRAQARMGLDDMASVEQATVGGAPLLHFEDQIGTIRTASVAEAERALDLERFRGMYAGKGMESMLIEHGVQYDVRYTEREEMLDDIGDYKLLVLPFSYSMSKVAFEKIKAAVDRGSRLLIFDQLAPTDEFGSDHSEPLLKPLLGHANVTFVDINLAVKGMSPVIRQQTRQMFLNALEGDAGCFNNNGAKVEYLVRRTEDGLILYLANWETQRIAQPVLGLPLDSGRYTLDVVLSDQPELRRGLIRDRYQIDASDLKNFSLSIQPGGVMLIKARAIDSN